MRRACQILAGTLTVFWLAIISAFSQPIPVMDNFWRLVAQEDTDGDLKITIHDHTTPFALHDETGADARTFTNEYQLSVLMQELKQADDQHIKTSLWTNFKSTKTS